MSSPRTVTISLPPELARRVDDAAEREGRTRSELFREAARQYLERRERLDALFDYGGTLARRTDANEQDVVDAVMEGRRATRTWSADLPRDA